MEIIENIIDYEIYWKLRNLYCTVLIGLFDRFSALKIAKILSNNPIKTVVR